MVFIRRFPDADIKELEATDLFQKCLKPDIQERFYKRIDIGRDVFPAVRNKRMDFYYKGGKLFSFRARKGFTTHNKYASVLTVDNRNPYVNEEHLEAISSFQEGYARIKENCANYSGVEAHGVAQLYGKFSCAKQKRSNDVVVLDIEISLKSDAPLKEPEPGKASRASSDQIDLLLFNTKNRILRFYEAKDYSNGEIRANSDKEPRIVKQMQRYARQLERPDVRKEILKAYEAHVEVINKLFNPEKPLPVPLEIDPTPRLLVFGFDKPQLSVLKKEIKHLEEDYGHSIYAIGDIKKVNPDTLFSGRRKAWL